MEIITSNDNLSITKDKQLYKIEFKYQSYEIINSLLKTRIIRDGITDDSYQTIKFKASSVRTLEQYQEYHNKIYGKKNFKIHIVAYMIRSLAEQLNYLLTYENMTILGYSPKEIIVIDDEKFAFVSSEFIAKINTEGSEMAMISCPFSYSETDNFFSPEICEIKEIPSYVYFKSCNFSLACLLIYVIEGNDDFYKNYLNEGYNPEKILETLDNHPIKNTKLYWLICRCLKDEPTERSLIYI
jgi:hypothetical protein